MINKAILIGNLGQEPEIKYTQSGSAIANFSIATTESWKDRATGEKKVITQWHKVVVFNENIAKFVEQYVKKGSKVYVEGSIQNRKYTAKDGVEKAITEIVITQFKGEIQILDSRQRDDDESNGEVSSIPPKKNNVESLEDLDDEIPF